MRNPGRDTARFSAPILSIGDADLRLLARPASIVVAVGLLLYLAATWQTYGVGPDEPQRQAYGRLLLDFYQSGLVDTRPLQQATAIAGGGLFDLLTAALAPLWTGSVWDLRHLVSGLFGLGGMLAAWRLARLLGGEAAALLAVVILALTGAWSGALFTHTAEIPLAACMSWALYFLTRLCADLPGLAPSHAFGFAVSSGAALAIGDSAWLMPICLVLCLLVAARRHRRGRSLFGRWLLALLPGVAIAAGLMLLGRPALLNGLAAAEPGALVPTLVDGSLLLSSEVPRSYLHDYLVVKLPELMLIGLGLALGGRPWRPVEVPLRVAERRAQTRRGRSLHLPLALAIGLPIAFAWLTRPALADGLRQFLFLLPALAVASALGWRMFWQALRGNPAAAWLMAAIVGLLVAIHTTTLAHLQPYGHVFYNSLAGGLRGAAGSWVLDYNASSLREDVDMLERYTGLAGTPSTERPAGAVPVLVCADVVQAGTALPPPFVPTRDPAVARFAIVASQPGCPAAGQGEVIHSVIRRGVVLGQLLDLRAAGASVRLAGHRG
ncbi:MAG: glycosyltransferase family 39 protein [Rhodocyclaceae bacterium]|nr:glycosyltransferase family 39 protein [Rhodocyclaceae bacterium]